MKICYLFYVRYNIERASDSAGNKVKLIFFFSRRSFTTNNFFPSPSQVLNESTNVPNHVHPSSSRATSRASSAPASPISKSTETKDCDIQCGIEIHALENGLAGRANTLKSYGQLNRVVRILRERYQR